MDKKRFLNTLIVAVFAFFWNVSFAQNSVTDKDITEQSIVETMDAGKAQARSGLTEDAYSSLQNALEQSGALFGKSSLEYARLSLEVGAVLTDTEINGKAKNFLTYAHEYFSEELGQSDLNTALAAFYLGKYWMNEGRGKRMNEGRELRALPLLEASLSVVERAGNQQAIVFMTHALIVKAYEKTDRSTEATPHLLALGEMIAAGYGSEYSELPIYVVAPAYRRYMYCGSSDSGSLGPCSVHSRPAQAEIEFDVNAQGVVFNARVANSVGDKNFTQAALTAIEQFRYAPRVVDGQAVNVEGLTVQFESES